MSKENPVDLEQLSVLMYSFVGIMEAHKQVMIKAAVDITSTQGLISLKSVIDLPDEKEEERKFNLINNLGNTSEVRVRREVRKYLLGVKQYIEQVMFSIDELLGDLEEETEE